MKEEEHWEKVKNEAIAHLLGVSMQLKLAREWDALSIELCQLN